MSQLEDDTTYCSEAANLERNNSKIAVYNEFDFTTPASKNSLAIDSKKEEILNLLEDRDAIIVRGFTGCGKTTQVPQFILDHCYSTRTPCNIAVTQPRRISALSVARRVSQERKWTLGTVVGYQVAVIFSPLIKPTFILIEIFLLNY